MCHMFFFLEGTWKADLGDAPGKVGSIHRVFDWKLGCIS